MKKIFCIFLPIILLVFVSFLISLTAKAYASEETGSISICKAIADQNGNVIDGSQAPGVKFTISGFVPSPVPIDGVPAGALPTSTFTTPLTLNAKVFSESTGNDSQCVNYSNLSFGAYYYGQEVIPDSGWQTALYNDQYTSIVSHVTDVFPYDGRLFSTDQSTVGLRNENADGSIILNEQKRPIRTLVVLNTLVSSNSNGGGNNGGGSNNSGSTNSNPSTCTDSPPASAPAITNVSFGNNNVTLTWTKAQDPVSYYLVAYGTKPGVYTFGNPNVGGKDTTSYTIQGLSGGTTYYFAVRAGNGCATGSFSNEVSIAPNGQVLNQTAQGFQANVLGITKKINQAVLGNNKFLIVKNKVCSYCVWLPIVLLEIFLVALLYYFIFRKRKSALLKWGVSAGIFLIGYLIFLFINRTCPSGVMNWILFTIPCIYFWTISIALFLMENMLLQFIFSNSNTQPTNKKKKK